jgi:hypothetical protein
MDKQEEDCELQGEKEKKLVKSLCEQVVLNLPEVTAFMTSSAAPTPAPQQQSVEHEGKEILSKVSTTPASVRFD